ncbi:acetyltransferase [Kitasatospora sp. NBC_01287]|uniref:GNAT family N-acetyltransferase n=1 Tax=Kitasatospora sp. NBC_01287 TaxID=2903573 RepID=UPI0022563B2C|nr:GNAT family N-acetyltransferase [Kitasatospora sp. NBC_01287]MCX4746501.1 acetyltransferase [Kitasatospora sp. NBC_01287]
MQGQPAHPAARTGRTRRPGGDAVRLRHHPQSGGGRMTALTTPAGQFRLRLVRPEDLPLITEWMNDPAVDAFWELAGPPSVTERHVRAQLDGDGRSVPQLGLLNGEPISYWEVYRVEQDRLAAYYPVEPGDIGLHLLLGPARSRGRGLGAVLLAAMAEHLLRTSPRVVAEPDVRNTPSVRAFARAGFTSTGEIELPEKRAALMMRERST